MCGRFAAFWDDQAIGYRLDADLVPGLPGPSWNIAPTQTVAVAVQGRDGARRLAPAYWSLIPPDAPTPRLDYPTFNARSETVLTRPTYRAAAEGFRAILPVSGYYEWDAGHHPWYFSASSASMAGSAAGDASGSSENPDSQSDAGAGIARSDNPARKDSKDGMEGKRNRGTRNQSTRNQSTRDGGQENVLWLAGLCSWWRDPATGRWTLTTTILTRDALGRAAQVHDRMPLLVPDTLIPAWLDRRTPGREILPAIQEFAQEQEEALATHEVAPLYGDGPRLLDPVTGTSDDRNGSRSQEASTHHDGSIVQHGSVPTQGTLWKDGQNEGL